MAIAAPRKIYTDQELLSLPRDGYQYELVDGELKRVPTFFDHDLIKTIFLAYLLPIARPLGYVTAGEAGCRMRGGNLRVPDISFTRRERIHEVRPQVGFGVASPDICIEIISDSEEADDIQRKVEEYFASGASFVWHLLAPEQQVRVFTAPTASILLNVEDKLSADDLLPGFRVRIRDLFDLGLDT